MSPSQLLLYKFVHVFALAYYPFWSVQKCMAFQATGPTKQQQDDLSSKFG